MSFTRRLQLKKNQLFIFTGIFLTLVFLVYRAFFGPTWHCYDKTREKRFTLRGKYVILYNFVVSSRDFGCSDSVTLCTHADLDSLRDIRQTARRFAGPVSLAVYTPGNDFFEASRIISYLRKCSHDSIRSLVTFHLVFDEDFYPSNSPEALYASYKETTSCTDYPLLRNTSTVHKAKNLAYPVNILQNIAREASQTYFLLSTDIKMVPTWFLAKIFMNMMHDIYSSISRNFENVVFVLPAFEVDEYTPIPLNRTYLSQVLVRGSGRVYRSLECPKCHVVPRMSYKKWMTKSSGDGLGVAYTTGYVHGWQPFFIGSRKDPGFDERCFWTGVHHRLSQVYTMCYQRYTFLVLDNAFLTYVAEYNKTTIWAVNHEQELYRNQLTRDFKTFFGEHECFDLL